MKYTLLLTLFIFTGLDYINAQTPASARWNLTSATTTSAAVDGNIVAPTEKLSNTTIKDYAGLEGSQRLEITGGNWPREGQRNNERYIEFSVSPAPGQHLRVTEMSVWIGASGGNNMMANIAYSKDSTFTSSETYYATTTGISTYGLSGYGVGFSGLPILNGETLYMRVFPYYTTAASAKYLLLKHAQILGNTRPAVAPPIVTTKPITNITYNSARTGGSVTDEGGSAIMEKGVVWSKTPNATVDSNLGKTNEGIGISSFTSNLTSLGPNTVYYVRAYATNNSGTGYGPGLKFTSLPESDTVAIKMCIGGDTSITANVSGNEYQWQVYNDTTFVNITDNQQLNGSTTATLHLSSVTPSRKSKYRCLVTTNNGIVNSKVYTISFQNFWVYTGSGTWENPLNWSCGKVPDEFTDVIISSGFVIIRSDASCRSIEITNGVPFSINPGSSLKVTH